MHTGRKSLITSNILDLHQVERDLLFSSQFIMENGCVCGCGCPPGVNVFLRKIAVAAASRPAVEISQQETTLSIQTSTSVRTTHISFTVGQSFSETTVDGRPCTVTQHPRHRLIYIRTMRRPLGSAVILCIFSSKNVHRTRGRTPTWFTFSPLSVMLFHAFFFSQP